MHEEEKKNKTIDRGKTHEKKIEQENNIRRMESETEEENKNKK